jgi:2',3'-cyclic-nucleotide 2'-phosphodiesterase (5'-nucleotidase family)
LLLDSGNFSDAASAVGTTKTKALVEAMAAMGYQVVNVGERDVRYGYDLFHKRTGSSPLTFVSSNIVDRESQEPIFEPHVIVEAASPDRSRKIRVGVIGAVRFNPVFVQPGPDGKEMSIAHPKDRVRDELAKVKAKGVDVVVLLAAMHRDDARRLAQENPGIDFVVGSYGGVFTTQRDQEGETWILYSGNQGKRLGVTRVFMNPDSAGVLDQQTKLHLMTALYPADPEMLAFVEDVPVPRPDANPLAVKPSDEPGEGEGGAGAVTGGGGAKDGR